MIIEIMNNKHILCPAIIPWSRDYRPNVHAWPFSVAPMPIFWPLWNSVDCKININYDRSNLHILIL
jgi:hypothetical protein